MAKTILLFEIKPEKKAVITGICKSQEIRMTDIRPADYLQPLGYLAGITGFHKKNTPGRGDRFPDEMLVFSGFDSEALDQFLHAYGASGAAPVDRKAILTLHNINWTPQQLFTELTKEHQAMHPTDSHKQKS